MSHKSSVAIHWRLFRHKYSLTGSECKKCSKKAFPPLKLCSNCGKKTEIVPLSGIGTIISFTNIHTSPEGFEQQIPYSIALIKLEEGPVISSQVVNKLDQSCMGKKVHAIFRKTYVDNNYGLNHYGFKFEII